MIEGAYQGFDVAIRDDGVAVLTFNHPERHNAMSFGAKRDLCEVLTLAQFDDAVRVLVLTGSGGGSSPASTTSEPAPRSLLL